MWVAKASDVTQTKQSDADVECQHVNDIVLT